MASLASSGVTVIRSWTTGGTTGKRNKVKLCSFGVITAGGLTNTLPATAFGLTRVERCSNLLVYTTATPATALRIYYASPNVDGSLVLLSDAKSSTAANQANVADAIVTTGESGLITVEGV